MLGLPDEALKDLLSEALDSGWEALAQHSNQQDATGQAARLAMSLRDAPALFKPDLNTLAIIAVPGETVPAPLLVREGSPVANWVPWAREALHQAGCPSLWLRATSALTVLDTALGLAKEHPA